MKVNDEVFEKMLGNIKSSLPSFHSHKRSARIYARRFLNGFSDNDREFIVKEILHQQNRSLVKAIVDKKNIAIPCIGSFQYRESLELIREIKKQVKKEFDVDDLRTVDEETYNIISEEIEVRKREVILPLYFKQLGGKGSTVNNDFLKKK